MYKAGALTRKVSIFTCDVVAGSDIIMQFVLGLFFIHSALSDIISTIIADDQSQTKCKQDKSKQRKGEVRKELENQKF